MKEITLKINKRQVTVPEGFTLLEAAQKAAVKIPTLCHHEELEPYGGCRLCMVEITRGKKTRLVAFCVYPVEEGLTVKTDTESVIKVRKMILELLLPLAPTGPLKKLAREYGVRKSRFIIDEEPSYCTLCGLCVRYCDEVIKEDAAGFIGRGIDREVLLVPEKGDACVFCRKCYELCEAGRFPLLSEAFPDSID
jgi:NADH dehydrogenase/NADH:ubiquinone oxidoreductase subunit G